MFHKIKGGSKFIIKDAFEVDMVCWVPPVGYGLNVATGEIEKTDILKRSDKKAEQYWEREDLPAWYAERQEMEEELQRQDPDYVDEKCEAVREKHWRRRLCGIWFYNNGTPTYMTGLHWFMLNWWNFQGKYFDFRIPNMELFYFLEYCRWDPNCLGDIEITKRKDGKCFAENTPIRMYDGSIKMVQDVINGDIVMGDNSKPRVVFDCTSGEEEMYHIVANKGESFTCNKSHILSLIWNSASTNSKYGWEKNGVVNISVEKYLLLTSYEKDHLVLYRKGWGEHFEEKSHFIPPYMIGVFLGDGSSHCGAITTIDKEILGYISDFAKSKNLKLTVTKNITYRIAQAGEKSEKDGKSMKHHSYNPYKNELRRLNILKNKHVPVEYLIDSEKNRLELLAGIIDTDGYLEKKEGHPKKYEITQKSKLLADGIIELARSLGFSVTWTNKVAKMKRADGSIYESSVKRISIYGDIHRIPCKIERKVAVHVKRRKDSMRFGFKVVPVGIGNYFGFAVDENNLFLLADGTVVHNTARAGCWQYEYISRTESKHGGIQSKSEDDAGEMYIKSIMLPWQKLPHFFRPQYDTSAGDAPKKGIRFFNPSRKGRPPKGMSKKQQAALESFIDLKNAKPYAYDGPELHAYVSDECGKLIEHSIVERHEVVAQCSEVDGVFVGKHHYTTTVEEMESGGGEFKRLVEMSDRRNLNANGRTATGLYVYFLPAYRTMYYDKYGFPDEVKGRAFFQAKRDQLANNPRSLSSYKRKNPFTLAECFRVDGDKCIYNSEALNDRLDALALCPDAIEQGNYVWENAAKYTRVKWEKNNNGRWWRVKRPHEDLERNNLTNRVEQRGNMFYPSNTMNFGAASDPFSHSKTQDTTKRSNAAGGVKSRFDPRREGDPYNDSIICIYHSRPKDINIYHDDMVKQCFYYGCKILFENNKNNWEAYFIVNNCEGFLARIEGNNGYGIHGNDNTAQRLCDLTEYHIENNIEKQHFPQVIQQWLDFDFANRTPYDLAMGVGYNFIEDDRFSVRTKETKPVDLGNFFRKHEINAA